MRLIKPIYVSAFALMACASMNAQQSKNPSTFTTKKAPLTEVQKTRWSHLDLQKDSIPGMSVDKAYAELLKGKKANKIIVGVIDSGLDIDHEDLKGKIWTNKKEIAGNNIDDDKNGFIDDVHGWNFLGEATNENLELTRILKKGDDGSENFKAAKAAFDKKLAEVNQQKPQVDMIIKADNAIKAELKKDKYTLADIKTITTTDSSLNQSKMIMMSIAMTCHII
jgi:subtilisin family serine protease